jgi:hypothetical protein
VLVSFPEGTSFSAATLKILKAATRVAGFTNTCKARCGWKNLREWAGWDDVSVILAPEINLQQPTTGLLLSG